MTVFSLDLLPLIKVLFLCGKASRFEIPLDLLPLLGNFVFSVNVESSALLQSFWSRHNAVVLAAVALDDNVVPDLLLFNFCQVDRPDNWHMYRLHGLICLVLGAQSRSINRLVGLSTHLRAPVGSIVGPCLGQGRPFTSARLRCLHRLEGGLLDEVATRVRGELSEPN